MPPTMDTMRLLSSSVHLRMLLVSQISSINVIRFISSEQLPRVAQPSLWSSMVPKFLRRSPNKPGKSRLDGYRRFFTHPYSSVLMLGMIIGSMAIHTLNLKTEIASIQSKADAKLALLREVIERVQKGENVDVEKELGTGDPVAEQEWEDVISEIESGERVWKKMEQTQKKRDEGNARRRENRARERERRKMEEQKAQERGEEGNGEEREMSERQNQEKTRKKAQQVFF